MRSIIYPFFFLTNFFFVGSVAKDPYGLASEIKRMVFPRFLVRYADPAFCHLFTIFFPHLLCFTVFTHYHLKLAPRILMHAPARFPVPLSSGDFLFLPFFPPQTCRFRDGSVIFPLPPHSVYWNQHVFFLSDPEARTCHFIS